MGTTTFALLTGMLFFPGQTPSDLMTINQREIQIPIRFDPARKKEIRELLLFTTKSQAESWTLVTRETPDKDFFTYKAPADGIYWFTMMIVDKSGKRDPEDINSAVAGLKVLIDTKAPTISIRSAEKSGDDVVVTWDVQEAYPNLKTLKLEGKGSDGRWNRVEIQPVLAGTGRIPGGVRSGVNQVRMEMLDLAENRGDSGIVDVKEASRATASNTEPSNLVPLNNPNGGINRISNEVPAPDLNPVNPLTENVIAPRNETAIAKTGPKTAPRTESTSAKEDDVTPPLETTERQLPKVQPIDVARFELGFSLESTGPSGISKAQLWVTRDDGKSWKMWKEYERPGSSIEVDLDVKGNPQLEGTYGFKIVAVSGGGLTRGQPRGGDLPDIRVDLDLTAPEIELFPLVADPNERDTLIFRWKAHDRNMASDPIILEWSERKEGPWHPVATRENREESYSGGPPIRRLPNIGSHAWKVGKDVPARVYLKISARDTAGNTASAVTDEPILVDLNRPEAKIQGIIGTSLKRKE